MHPPVILLMASSQPETWKGLSSVTWSTIWSVSSEKRTDSDASSQFWGGCFKFELAGQVGIANALSGVGSSKERKAAPKSMSEALQPVRPTFR